MADEGAEELCEDLSFFENKSGLAEVGALDTDFTDITQTFDYLGYEVSSFHPRAV